MLDERAEPVVPELRHHAFNNKSVGQRAAIIAAGPVANFIFAIFAYWLVFIIGVPGVRPVVGEIAANSIAAEAQIALGTELKAVDGIETPDWDAVRLQLVDKIGDESTGRLSLIKKIRYLRWGFVLVGRKLNLYWKMCSQTRRQARQVCKQATGSLKSMVSP